MSRLTGNSKLSKKINRALILQYMRRYGSISRTDLVAKTGLTSGTVSNITNDLIREGLVIPKGTQDSNGGRPKVLLEINPRACLVLGVNIGGTKIVSVLTDLDAHVIARHDAILDSAWPLRQQLDTIISCIQNVIPCENSDRIVGAGVGIPGILDSKNGTSVFSPNLGWRNVPVRKLLQDALGMPVVIDNVVRCGVLGERWWGQGRAHRNMIALFVGTGVGAGMVLDGHVYRGAHEAAGEIGHVIVAEGGEQCRCGRRGCLEAMASGTAIAKQATKRIEAGESSVLRRCLESSSKLTGRIVYDAAVKGDPLALEVMHTAGHYIGVGMAIMINLFNPELLVFNGGVSNSWPLIGETIRKTVNERVMEGPAKQVIIVPSELGDSVGPLGAATLVIQDLFLAPDVSARTSSL